MNDAEDVLTAFKTYYETARLEANTDPHLVFDLRAKLDGAGFYESFEVDQVAHIETDPKGTQAQLSAALAPVADRLLKRYKALQAQRAAAEASHDKDAAQAGPGRDGCAGAVQGRHGRLLPAVRLSSQIFDYGNTDIEQRFLLQAADSPPRLRPRAGHGGPRKWCRPTTP